MLEKLINIVKQIIELSSEVPFLDLIAGENYKELLVSELKEFMCYVSYSDERNVSQEEVLLYNRILDEDYSISSLNPRKT